MKAGNMEWDQLAEESAAAYARFLVYLHLGPGRTLQAAWDAHNAGNGANRKKSEKMSGQWRDDSTAHRWVARAKAWDIAEQQRFAIERQEEERARRRALMDKYHEKVVAMTDTLDPAKATVAQILEAIRNYLSESRQETSDLPTMQHDHRVSGKDGGPIEVAMVDPKQKLKERLDKIAARREVDQTPPQK